MRTLWIKEALEEKVQSCFSRQRKKLSHHFVYPTTQNPSPPHESMATSPWAPDIKLDNAVHRPKCKTRENWPEFTPISPTNQPHRVRQPGPEHTQNGPQARWPTYRRHLDMGVGAESIGLKHGTWKLLFPTAARRMILMYAESGWVFTVSCYYIYLNLQLHWSAELCFGLLCFRLWW